MHINSMEICTDCIIFSLFQSSFTEVAKLFTEFFRDLDVVPSDVVAGLVLLRKHQKMRRKHIVAQVNILPMNLAICSLTMVSSRYFI